MNRVCTRLSFTIGELNLQKDKANSALSSNLKVGLIVGTFVGVVVIALALSVMLPPASQGSSVSLQSISLFSGSASAHSFTTSCQGDAKFEIYFENPTSQPIGVSQTVVYGGPILRNDSVLLSGSNSCLYVSEVNPQLGQGSTFFDGYVNGSLAFGTVYDYTIVLSNGQVFNGTLIAQD